MNLFLEVLNFFPSVSDPLPPWWGHGFIDGTVGVAAAAAKLLQSCPTLCDPIDSSPPGSAVPGILQARTLEWVAISFSLPPVNLKFIFLLENFMQECMLPSVLSVKVI